MARYTINHKKGIGLRKVIASKPNEKVKELPLGTYRFKMDKECYGTWFD